MSDAAPSASAPATQRISRLVRFGPEQGLSKFINGLSIDRRGHLWIATGDGLARYDGIEFRHWRREPGRPGALPRNNALVVHIDAHDRIWVATQIGLSVLGRDRRDFRHIGFEAMAGACAKDISALNSSVEGGVWVGNYYGDICHIAEDGRAAPINLRAQDRALLEDAVITALHHTAEGALLIGTDEGLLAFEHGRLRRVSHQAFVYSLSRVDDVIWVGTDGGLFRMDEHGLRPAPWAALGHTPYPVILRDRSGHHWVGSASGVHRERNGDIESLGVARGPDAGATQTGLESGVFEMVEDREGGLWFATYSQGLAYLPPDWKRFRVIADAGGVAVDHMGLLAAAADARGDYWVLAERGLYRLRAGDSLLRQAADPRALQVERPRSLSACDDGRLLLTDALGVVVYDPALGHGRRWLRIAREGIERIVERVVCMPDGEVWLSMSEGGIEIYDHDGRLRRALPAAMVLGNAASQFAELTQGPDGRPWLANGYALRRWDGERFVNVALAQGEHVYTFDTQNPTELWVARFGALERYRWDGRQLHLRERVGPEQGMPLVEISGVLATSRGQVWVSTVRGLALYDKARSRVRLFGVRDGLPGADYSLGPAIENGSGQALALSMDGVTLFSAELPLPPPRAPMLAIDRLALRRGDREIALDPAAAVRMRPGDRDLRIVPRLLSYSDPLSHRYRFKLHGYDQDWVRLDAPAERVFSTLPDGRHLLEVQGAHADGVWSTPAQLVIEVSPPWWRAWWAIVLYALIAATLLALSAHLYRLRLKRRHAYRLAEQQRRFAEQASEAKSRFLADFGHEVRTPMTGVLGMSELLLGASGLSDRQRGQVQSIRRAGEHLLRLVDDALDLARIEAGKLELASTDVALDGLIDDVDSLMRPLAERKGLAFRTEIVEGAPRHMRGDVTRIRQILLNLLSNAIKFTERGEVALYAERASDAERPEGASAPVLRLRIADTGPGLTADQQQRLFRRFEQAEGARTAARYGGSGLGLSICRELAQAMGGDILVDSAPGLGTRFSVTLPLPVVEAAEPFAGAKGGAAAGRIAVSTDSALDGVSPPAALADAAWLDTPARDMSSLQILLVEDEATVAEVIIGLLQARGHRPVHAAHGLAAMTEVALRHFDLALLDLDLPGIDGFALARQLRAGGFARPLIALTARADAEAEPQAMVAGFDAFLRKPLTSEMLIAAMRAALAKHDAQA